MWFEDLTGFSEESPHKVRANITVDGTVMTSHVNGAVFNCGELELPSSAELRLRVQSHGRNPGRISVREVVANVQDLHADEGNAGALFQVASQFNLLEMVSSDVTPEAGVGIYEHDLTQGPACAIAAGAGTIYRNYFASVNGEIGQTATHQIDCLADVAAAMGSTSGELWEMKNGYVFASEIGLAEISNRLRTSTDRERDRLRGLLRVGLQSATQVTLNDSKHLVSQVYCSALPVAYSSHAEALWEDFATLVLEAAYEATICAGIENARRCGNNTVFLTLLGGGVFGNNADWIIQAIKRSVHRYRDHALDLAIVSHGASNPLVQELIRSSALPGAK